LKQAISFACRFFVYACVGGLECVSLVYDFSIRSLTVREISNAMARIAAAAKKTVPDVAGSPGDAVDQA